MKYKIYPLLVLLIFSMLTVINLQAATPPGPPMGGGGNPGCWPPSTCDVPIDGGLSFLIAAGAGLAGKKFYDYRKKSKE